MGMNEALISVFCLILFYSFLIHPIIVSVRIRINLNKIYKVRVPVKVTYHQYIELIKMCKDYNLDCDQVYLNERGQTIKGDCNTLYNGVFSFRNKNVAMYFKLLGDI